MNVLSTKPLEPFQLEIIAGVAPGVTVRGASSREEMLDLVRDADVLYFVWTGVPLDGEVIRAAGRLRWIHVGSTGVERVLIPELVESDVVVTNSRDVHAVPVAEHAFAQLMTIAKRFQAYEQQRMSKVWRRRDPDILSGKVLGIIGYGSIGREIARRARAFGMKVQAVGSAPRVDARGRVFGPDSIPEVLGTSDYVVLCLPLTAETKGLFSRPTIFSMKEGSYLVNVARGGIVDEDALADALETGHLAGAAFDVFEDEPLPSDSRLWNTRNLFITPHVAGSFPGHLEALARDFAENLRRWAAGEPLLNVVDKRRGY